MILSRKVLKELIFIQYLRKFEYFFLIEISLSKTNQRAIQKQNEIAKSEAYSVQSLNLWMHLYFTTIPKCLYDIYEFYKYFTNI